MATHNVDEQIPISKAVDLVPGRPHVATLHRWYLTGVKGPNGKRVKLEVTRVGGRIFTTPAAIESFLERLNPESAEKNASDDSARRGREASKALEALGA